MMLPFGAPPHYSQQSQPQTEGASYWYIFSGDLLLIGAGENEIPEATPFAPKRTLYMGTWKGQNLFAAEIEDGDQVLPGYCWRSLRTLYGTLSEEHFSLAGRAMQMLHWDHTHAYCGCCGHETFIRQAETCRECPSCKHLAYPKIAPAVLALVKKDQQILLAHAAHFSEKFYSVIAGFVDPGETLEQCVAREVLEEVGIYVHNIRYFGSQPWPFSQSLMIAFTCDWLSGEIQIDPQELDHADWFEPTHLPALPPPMSLSRFLIDSCIH